jgi:beta-lactamase class A
MDNYSLRRRLLLASATMPIFVKMSAYAMPAMIATPSVTGMSLAELERDVGGRLGVFVLDSATGHHVQHRAGERFPFCSTANVMVCAAVLARSVKKPSLLQQRVVFGPGDVAGARYTPVTQTRVEGGMIVSELCEAAVQYGDNAATNLLVHLIGGPSAVTSFARSIGDTEFRLDRPEPKLNTAIPGDERDTSTPAAMAHSLRALVLGNALHDYQRARLVEWLRNSTMGDRRIRAGVPTGWRVDDKTGTGAYGTTNDIAVLWPPSGRSIILTVYYTQAYADAKAKDAVVASAAQIALTALLRE